MKFSPKFSKYVARTILLVIIFVIAAHVLSALTFDRRIGYTEISYRSTKITSELDGYVIAFVTDTHEITPAAMQSVIENITRREVDLLLLGGDFANTLELMRQNLALLGSVNPTDGTYGVDGNHDKFWELLPAMQEYGIVPLDNRGVRLKPGFYLAGVQDAWVRTPNVAKAIAHAEPIDFILLLSHNPDVSLSQDMSGVDLMLSGHYHGGHITVFGLWAPALWPLRDFTAYGQKFMHGWAKGNDDVDVFVSTGAGLSRLPRVFARPEVVYLTLIRE